MSYIERFKDAGFMDNRLKDEMIIIGGVGGIGSTTALSLAKTFGGWPAIYLIDMDAVEEHNIGTQLFSTGDIGTTKVFAIQNMADNFIGPKHNFRCINNVYGGEATPIMISAFDNMEARKQMFSSWREKDSRQIFIDGRLRANLYEVYAVTKGREDEYEKTLFEDSDVDDGPCTFKQTFYFSLLIGARITHVLVNYLTNKYSGEDVCNIPFKIQEVGEPFLIKTEFV